MPDPEQHPSLRRNACVECYKRKIRCDRTFPCAHCQRSRLECFYAAPLPPNRKRPAAASTSENVARLERLERIIKLFRQGGLPSASPGGLLATPAEGVGPSRGRALPVEASSRDKLRADLPFGSMPVGAPQATQQDDGKPLDGTATPSREQISSSAHGERPEDVPAYTPFLGLTSSYHGESSHQHAQSESVKPTAQQSSLLWHTFMVHCHPMIRLFNPSSAESILVRYLQGVHPGSDSRMRSDAAFALAVYSLAVASMENEHCEGIMGLPQGVLLDKFVRATEAALSAVDVVGSRCVVDLQSLTMHLLCVQSRVDHGKLWSLMGIAMRIAQRMGLNRDGRSLGLTPYETELRRRLWWQLFLLDMYTAEHTGGRGSLCLDDWDVELPSDIDDCDLQPELKSGHDFLLDKNPPRDMFNFRVRYEILRFLHRLQSPSGRETGARYLLSPKVSLQERESILDHLEVLIQQKYLDKADFFIPIHRLAIYAARAVMTRLRLLVLCPQDMVQELPREQCDRILSLSVVCLDYDASLHSDHQLREFAWLLRGFFHWAGLLTLLMELNRRAPLLDLDADWSRVHDAYLRRPGILLDERKALPRAAGKLVLLAWGKRERRGLEEGVGCERPAYIDYLKGLFGEPVCLGSGVSGGVIQEVDGQATVLAARVAAGVRGVQDPIQQICNYADELWGSV